MSIETVLHQSASLEALERVDSMCVDFENALRAGERPRVEDMLGRALPADRKLLLRELLAVEFGYRFANTEPNPTSYYARFPDHRDLIDSVCQQYAEHRNGTGGELPRAFGDFELIELLGRGGMAVVYKARQMRGDQILRTVAFKLIRPDRISAASVQRFLAEQKYASLLEHANIVRVYEVGTCESKPYFSMQLIRGHSLEDLLRTSPLQSREAARIIGKVAGALDYAHQHHKMIHRDVKPRNILIDGSQEPYLADFGLAKWLSTEHDLTETGELLGTAPYMSPEQAQRRKDIGVAADVYGLGATLYAMLTGRPPFQADKVVETLNQVVHKEPVPPRQLNPQIDRDLETICMVCLEKDERRRYQSAAEVEDEVTRFLARRPIRRRPLTLAGRTVRWSRRQPIMASLLALVALLVLAAATVGSLVAIHVRGVNLALKDKVKELDHANTDLSSQKERAQSNRQRADRNLAMLMNVLDGVLTHLGDERLKNVPQMTSFRHKVLEDALEFYQQLVEEESDDTVIQHQLARAHFRVANIDLLLGRDEAAGNAYQAAIAAYENLLTIQPNASVYRFEMAASECDWGNVLHGLQRFDEAESAYLRAVRFIRSDKNNSLVPESKVLYEEAGLLNNLAGLYHSMGRSDQAIDYSQQAIDAYSAIPEQYRKNLDYQRAIAGTHSIAAGILVETGQPKTGEKAARESLEVVERAISQFPEDIELQIVRATTTNNLALALSSQQRFDEAIGFNRKSVELHQIIADEFPAVPQYRYMFALERYNLATLLETVGRFDEAVEQLAAVVEDGKELVKRFPSRSDYTNLLARAYDNLAVNLDNSGRPGFVDAHGEGLALFRRLVEQNPDVPLSVEGFARSLVIQFRSNLQPDQLNALVEDYREAIDLLEDLQSRNPQMVRYRHALADAYGGRARIMLRVGNVSQSLKDMTQCVETHRQSVKDFPDDQGLALRLASSLSDLAALFAMAGYGSAGERYLRESIRVQLELLDVQPVNRKLKEELAASLANAGTSLLRADSNSQALDILDHALRLNRELVADAEENLNPLEKLRICQNSRALALLGMRRTEEAAVAAEEAVSIARSLKEEHPDNANYPGILGGVLNTLSQVRIAQDDESKAVRLLEEAVEQQLQTLAMQPNHPVYTTFLNNHLQLLARTVLKPGMRAEVAATADRMATVTPERFDVKLVAGRLFIGCHHLARQDESLSSRERDELTKRYAEFASSAIREAETLASSARDCHQLSWLMSMFPLPEQVDFKRALELAMQSIQQQPSDPFAYRSLAAAHYRAGEWSKSIQASVHALKLAQQGDSAHGLFLAMAYSKIGDNNSSSKEAPESDSNLAREWYDKSVEWSKFYWGTPFELEVLRQEAARTLKIAEQDVEDAT